LKSTSRLTAAYRTPPIHINRAWKLIFKGWRSNTRKSDEVRSQVVSAILDTSKCQWYYVVMAVCDCCHREKPDAAAHPSLYARDAEGRIARHAYLGFLCDACLTEIRKPGTPENLWLLKQVGLET